MPAIGHVKSNGIADFANTVTVYNSQGSSATVAATDLIRPGDWNSAHVQSVYISGNTSGTSSHTATNVVFGASGGITASMSTAASAATIYYSAAQHNDLSEFEPISGSAVLTNSTLGQNSLYFVPFYLPEQMYVSRVNFFASATGTMSADAATGSGGMTLSAALYTRMSDSIDRISRYWSNSWAVSGTQNSNTQLVMTNVIGLSDNGSVSTVATSITDANASTYIANIFNGYRVWAMPVGSTLSPGRYWLCVANSTTQANGTFSLNASIGQQTVGGVAQIGYVRVGTSSSASNISQNRGCWYGAGTYSATSGAFPASIPLTSDSIRAALTLTLPYFNLSGFGTASGVL